MITELKENEVFVFGSNILGSHAGGAARTAVEKFGAIEGKGVGMQGKSYAIPTMGGMNQIILYSRDFLEYATLRPDLTFYLTRIACGIAGYSDEQIKPLFVTAPSNVIKPEGW